MMLEFNTLHFAYKKALEDVANAYTIKARAEHGAQSPLPHWFPDNPYPIGMTQMTIERYVELVPDSHDRTGISWMLYSHAYHVAQQDMYALLRRFPGTLRELHEYMAQ